MNSVFISVVVLAIVYGAGMAGMALRRRIPERYLTADTIAHMRIGASLLTSMFALLLSLQLSSGKNAFDQQEREASVMASKLALLDGALVHYGTASADARAALRRSIIEMLNRGWPRERFQAPNSELNLGARVVVGKIEELKPESDAQRAAKAAALSLVIELGESRWLTASTIRSSTSIPLMVVEIAWGAIVFFSFGMFGPRNLLVVATLFIYACAVAAGFFLIVEMTTPFGGLISASSTPLRDALVRLGQ